MLKHFIFCMLWAVSVTWGLGNQASIRREFYSDIYKMNQFRAANVYIVKWKEYITEVAQEFIYELEDFGLCNVVIDEYLQNSSRHFFGYEVIGTVTYTNGFIGTLQKASLNENKFVSPNTNESSNSIRIGCTMLLQDIMIYYDYYANLTKGNFSGTVGIPIDNAEFVIEAIIYYNNASGTVAGNLQLLSVRNPQSKIWYFTPTNKYMEIINRSNDYSFFEKMKNILNEEWIKLLNNVLIRIPIPEHCFNCNIKT